MSGYQKPLFWKAPPVRVRVAAPFEIEESIVWAPGRWKRVTWTVLSFRQPQRFKTRDFITFRENVVHHSETPMDLHLVRDAHDRLVVAEECYT